MTFWEHAFGVFLVGLFLVPVGIALLRAWTRA